MHLITANVHSTLTLPAMLGNLLFLQTIALPGMGGRTVPLFGSNGPLWSLSNEFWYYIAFPLMVLLMARGRSWQARASYAAGLIVWGWFVGAKIALLGIPWLMGVLITVLPRFPAGRTRTRSLAIVFALVLFGGGLALGKALDSLASNLILGAIVTFLIWVTLYCATAPLPEAYVKAAHRAARSSYTLYLVHLPMLIFLKASLHLPRSLPSWHILVMGIGLLMGIVLYAQVVYELFERNTERVRDWIKPYVLGRKAA
jgi:peptidoglycan/LPS O-acetylase OafA/YrhL